MKKKLITVILPIIIILISSCSLTENETLTIHDLNIPSEFEFKTTQLINVTALGPVTKTLKISNESDEIIYRGLLKEISGFNQGILVPTNVKVLKFEYNNEIITRNISPDQGGVYVYFHNSSRERFVDSDGDLVPDEEDDFPLDPNYAYRNYYPPQPADTTRCVCRNYSTIAFEDLWPKEGDYDFNDVIINYLIEERTNGRGNVRFINFDIYYSVDGAGFNNGFYIKLPFDETMVAQVNFPDSLQSREGFDYYYDIENGGDGNIVLRFFEGGRSFMPDNPSQFHNTEDDSEFTNPIFFSLNILLLGSEEYINRPFKCYPPYNPFLVINQEIAREVHFGNYQPTNNINTDYFGAEDDTSDPAIDRYFLTSIGLPWGMHIPSLINNPLERVSIIDAYPQFADWATSGGQSNTDWYLYPVDGNVYNFIEQFEDSVNLRQ